MKNAPLSQCLKKYHLGISIVGRHPPSNFTNHTVPPRGAEKQQIFPGLGGGHYSGKSQSKYVRLGLSDWYGQVSLEMVVESFRALAEYFVHSSALALCVQSA